jgi:hypothetical protein
VREDQRVASPAHPDLARAIGRPFVADAYLKLRNYTNNLRRQGYTDDDFTGGGSDRLVDALVLHGSVDAIAAGLRAHLDASADHVAIQVLTAEGHDPIPGYRQLAHALL